MPRVGYEPMIPAFERAKTFHALDRAATVIGNDIGTPHRKAYCMRRVQTKDARDYKSQLDTAAVAQQTNAVQGLPVHRTSETYFIDTW
jgi:hypothetical protein